MTDSSWRSRAQQSSGKRLIEALPLSRGRPVWRTWHRLAAWVRRILNVRPNRVCRPGGDGEDRREELESRDEYARSHVEDREAVGEPNNQRRDARLSKHRSIAQEVVAVRSLSCFLQFHISKTGREQPSIFMSFSGRCCVPRGAVVLVAFFLCLPMEPSSSLNSGIAAIICDVKTSHALSVFLGFVVDWHPSQAPQVYLQPYLVLQMAALSPARGSHAPGSLWASE